MKPTGQVKFSSGIENSEKIMRFNQTQINYMISKSGKTESKHWVNMKYPLAVDKIKGNFAFVPKI